MGRATDKIKKDKQKAARLAEALEEAPPKAQVVDDLLDDMEDTQCEEAPASPIDQLEEVANKARKTTQVFSSAGYAQELVAEMADILAEVVSDHSVLFVELHDRLTKLEKMVQTKKTK